MSLLSRKPAPPVMTEARRVLADAIVASNAAAADRRAVQAAAGPAGEAVSVARRQLAEAQEGVGLAQADAARHLQLAALGDTADEAPPSIRAARQRVEDAEDGVQAALLARDGLESRMTSPADHLARDRVKSAALAVLADEGGGYVKLLAAEVDALQRDMLGKAVTLEWLAHRTGNARDPAVVSAVTRIYSIPTRDWQLHTPSPAGGAGPWVAALAALETDAATVLPI